MGRGRCTCDPIKIQGHVFHDFECGRWTNSECEEMRASLTKEYGDPKWLDQYQRMFCVRFG